MQSGVKSIPSKQVGQVYINPLLALTNDSQSTLQLSKLAIFTTHPNHFNHSTTTISSSPTTNNMSDKNTSTLQSYVDSATGAAQSALGSIIGSNADKVCIPGFLAQHRPAANILQNAGEQKKAEADVKNDASHAGATIGGYSVSASGVTQNDPNRSAGSWNQTIGSGKEAIGNMLGAEGLKQQGAQQNQEGKEQEAKGQLNDLGSGIADRVSGTVGGAIAGVTGNEADKAKYQAQHDEGKTQQRGVEADLDKQARA